MNIKRKKLSYFVLEEYISYALDFVSFSSDDLKKAKEALESIGLYEEDRYLKHKEGSPTRRPFLYNGDIYTVNPDNPTAKA